MPSPVTSRLGVVLAGIVLAGATATSLAVDGPAPSHFTARALRPLQLASEAPKDAKRLDTARYGDGSDPKGGLRPRTSQVVDHTSVSSDSNAEAPPLLSEGILATVEPSQLHTAELTNTTVDMPATCSKLELTVSFDDVALVDRDGQRTSRPVAIQADCGVYEVSLTSIDRRHAAGYQTDQTHEQWLLEGLDEEGTVVARSAPTDDLPEEVTTAVSSVGRLDLTGVVQLRARHAGGPGGPNSVMPALATLRAVNSVPATSMTEDVDDGDIEAARVGEETVLQLIATGVPATAKWQLSAGKLPAGLAIHPSGSLLGTAEEDGRFSITLIARSDSTLPALRSSALATSAPKPVDSASTSACQPEPQMGETRCDVTIWVRPRIRLTKEAVPFPQVELARVRSWSPDGSEIELGDGPTDADIVVGSVVNFPPGSTTMPEGALVRVLDRQEAGDGTTVLRVEPAPVADYIAEGEFRSSATDLIDPKTGEAPNSPTVGCGRDIAVETKPFALQIGLTNFEMTVTDGCQVLDSSIAIGNDGVSRTVVRYGFRDASLEAKIVGSKVEFDDYIIPLPFTKMTGLSLDHIPGTVFKPDIEAGVYLTASLGFHHELGFSTTLTRIQEVVCDNNGCSEPTNVEFKISPPKMLPTVLDGTQTLDDEFHLGVGIGFRIGIEAKATARRQAPTPLIRLFDFEVRAGVAWRGSVLPAPTRGHGPQKYAYGVYLESVFRTQAGAFDLGEVFGGTFKGSFFEHEFFTQVPFSRSPEIAFEYFPETTHPFPETIVPGSPLPGTVATSSGKPEPLTLHIVEINGQEEVSGERFHHPIRLAGTEVTLSIHEVPDESPDASPGPAIEEGLVGTLQATSDDSGTIRFDQDLLLSADIKPGLYLLKATADRPNDDPFLVNDEIAGVSPIFEVVEEEVPISFGLDGDGVRINGERIALGTMVRGAADAQFDRMKQILPSIDFLHEGGGRRQIGPSEYFYYSSICDFDLGFCFEAGVVYNRFEQYVADYAVANLFDTSCTADNRATDVCIERVSRVLVDGVPVLGLTAEQLMAVLPDARLKGGTPNADICYFWLGPYTIKTSASGVYEISTAHEDSIGGCPYIES